MRALIAEDDNDFRTILTNLLVSLGVSVREAETAEQALAHFREESGAFDVLFTDLRMPGMGGLELMRLIRRAAPDLPMVVITGHANLDFALESIRLQVAGFLKKPFTAEELEALVQQINGRQPPTVARDSPPSEFWRTQLVRVLTLSVECWRLATGKDKSALATESGLWRVHFDKSTPAHPHARQVPAARHPAPASAAGSRAAHRPLRPRPRPALPPPTRTRSRTPQARSPAATPRQVRQGKSFR